jgi:hypothetical protein
MLQAVYSSAPYMPCLNIAFLYYQFIVKTDGAPAIPTLFSSRRTKRNLPPQIFQNELVEKKY